MGKKNSNFADSVQNCGLAVGFTSWLHVHSATLMPHSACLV